MTAFTPIAFLDTWALSSSLRSKLGLFERDGYFRARVESGEGYRLASETREWTGLKNIIARMARHPASAQHEMGLVTIERLLPHTESPWASGGPDAWVEVAIVTNPDCFVFCGTLWQHFPIGWLTSVNRGMRCCSVNWGDTPRFHLIATFHRKEAETC